MPVGQPNFYARLEIAAPSRPFDAPQVWHFAVRRLKPGHAGWQPYGFIEREGFKVHLYHFKGGVASTTLSRLAEPFVVETFFADRLEDYRIASLHPFKISIKSPASGNQPSVRFER
jgi:hypothetical protein